VTAPVKDGERARPVPDVWQPTLSAIVASLEREDAVIAAELPAVDPVCDDLSDLCRDAIRRYADVRLVPLPTDTWGTSVCLWRGDRWQCLVDLWTVLKDVRDWHAHEGPAVGLLKFDHQGRRSRLHGQPD
jgi:hypothetical protein